MHTHLPLTSLWTCLISNQGCATQQSISGSDSLRLFISLLTRSLCSSHANQAESPQSPLSLSVPGNMTRSDFQMDKFYLVFLRFFFKDTENQHIENKLVVLPQILAFPMFSIPGSVTSIHLLRSKTQQLHGPPSISAPTPDPLGSTHYGIISNTGFSLKFAGSRARVPHTECLNI